MALLVGELDDNYGAIHDEDDEALVVPWATMVVNKENTSKQDPGMTTKKFLLGIMGVTAVVASGASLFYSVLVDSSGRHARTPAEAFLLNDRGDDKCVPASGPWPAGAVSMDDDSYKEHSPFVTCFVSTTGGYCWSHSYYNSETWQACTPYGFDEKMWSIYERHNDISVKTRDGADDDGAANPLDQIYYYEDKYSYVPLETCGTPCTKFSPCQ
jgi:hypothetical protein